MVDVQSNKVRVRASTFFTILLFSPGLSSLCNSFVSIGRHP